jgi:integrase
MKPLTATEVKNAKPKANPYKRGAGKGLYMLVTPNGSKLWRMKYRFGGSEKLLALGKYPDTTLKEAGEKRDAARKLLDSDPPTDPAEVKRAEKAATAGSFRAIGQQWFADKQSHLAKVTRDRNKGILKLLNKLIGKRPISKIRTTELRSALLTIQKNNGPETARRARGIASRVFAYAVAHGKASGDPTAGLQDVLKARNTKSRSALTKPAEVGELLRAIDSFSGQETTKVGLKLLALNFTRPTEIRLGKWEEIDLIAGTWEIPASRMKMRSKNPTSHLLPLSKQSVKTLKELRKFTGDDWVFPTNTGDKPLSENAFNNALAKIGYGTDKHTAHGFRSTASTLLHEMNFPPEVIETQLAHARPGVAAVYNRSHLLPQRKKMLQAWANYLDQLRKDEKVVPIKSQGAA